MSEVTIKDTKQIIFDKLVETQKKLHALQAGKSNPVEEAKKVETKTACESAAVSVEAGIFSDDLNQKYNDVMTAISVGEKRLEELYGIEKELTDLTTIVNAHKDSVIELAQERNAQEADNNQYLNDMRIKLSEEIDAIRKANSEEKEALRKDLAAYKVQLKLDREREAEEYTYNLERERAKEDDRYADIKAEREAVIATAEAKVDAAWDEVNDKLEYMKELEEKVSTIPGLVEAAKSEGAAAKEKELGKEYGYKKSMAEKDHEYEVNRLTDRLDAAEAENIKKDNKIASLEEKLDAAYAKIEALAGRTVDAAGGVKIIGSTNGTQSK